MNDLETINNTTFESIKHIDENGIEFWNAIIRIHQMAKF